MTCQCHNVQFGLSWSFCGLVLLFSSENGSFFLVFVIFLVRLILCIVFNDHPSIDIYLCEHSCVTGVTVVAYRILMKHRSN